MAPHVCLAPGCAVLVHDRVQPRCPRHGRRRAPAPDDGRYDRRHRELTRRAIAAHVRQHGWVCPGWRRPQHPVPVGGLTGDHIQSIEEHPELAYEPSNYGALCRSCNSRKGHRSGSWLSDPTPRRGGRSA